MANEQIIKQAAEAIRNLSAELDLMKLASEKVEKRESILRKLVDNDSIKTAQEYLDMREKLASSSNEEAYEKALELFPEGVNMSFGKVAAESPFGGLSAEEDFLNVIMS